jgi:hypothetical protein
MERDRFKYLDKNSMKQEIVQSRYGDHNLIVCSELTSLEYIYLNYGKISLESLNEIVLIIPHYHSVADVLNRLTSNGTEVDEYQKEGSIVIVESKKAYYGLTHEFVGPLIMTKMLIQRAHRLGKAGVMVISDVGLFFDINRIDDLIKYETELLYSLANMKVKVLCVYNKSNFELNIEHETQENLLNAHNNKRIFLA